MGMFDYIRCEYKLPVESLSSVCIDYDKVQEALYQTKDFDCFLHEYVIDSDGNLGINKKGDEIEYLNNTTCSIVFYERFERNDHNTDLWVEWKASFHKGKLDDLNLDYFHEDDNSNRKKSEKFYEEYLKKKNEYLNSKKYKYFFKYLESAKRFCIINIINFLQKITTFLYKIYLA